MSIEIFLFALMVFGMVLVILAMVLYAKKQRQEGLTEKEYQKKEEKLMLLYFEVEDMIKGLKEYVEHARELLGLEFDRLQAQAQAVRAGEKTATAAETPGYAGALPEREDLGVLYAEAEPAPAEDFPDKPARYELAAQMARDNVNPADIAEELHLSRSEINFIRKLSGQSD